VYLGDTARVPYGTRSAQTVIRYARACGAHLAKKGVKALVVACNTVSAVALDTLRIDFDRPVLGVVEPGARAAVAASKRGRIGVLATQGTVKSGAYPRAVAALDSRAEVFARAAPLLVPLAEEGWTEGDVPEAAARRYLESLVREEVDAIVLGCTHYPLLRTSLARALATLGAASIPLVDSTDATAQAVQATLADRGLLREGSSPGALTIAVTDQPAGFREMAARFLGAEVDAVETVDIGG
jgi:glutamate racemase